MSYYAGTWNYVFGNNALTGIYFIINSDGSITHKVNGMYWDEDEKIPATSIKKLAIQILLTLSEIHLNAMGLHIQKYILMIINEADFVIIVIDIKLLLALVSLLRYNNR